MIDGTTERGHDPRRCEEISEQHGAVSFQPDGKQPVVTFLAARGAPNAWVLPCSQREPHKTQQAQLLLHE